MTYWKCSQCGNTIKDNKHPDECPSCHVKCTFMDVTCYTPDCQFEGIDYRITAKPDSSPLHK